MTAFIVDVICYFLICRIFFNGWPSGDALEKTRSK
jgi:hypothetical protein